MEMRSQSPFPQPEVSPETAMSESVTTGFDDIGRQASLKLTLPDSAIASIGGGVLE